MVAGRYRTSIRAQLRRTNFISKIFKAIFAAVKKVIKAIWKFIKKYWFIILLLVIIYFAPLLTTWLTSVGAPAWLSTSMMWIATNVTPMLMSAVGWVISSGGALLSSAGTWFGSLGFGAQAALIAGATYLLAPEETTEAISSMISGVADMVGDIAGAVVGGVGTALFSSPLGLLLAGVGLYWLFGGSKKKKDDAVQAKGKDDVVQAKKQASIDDADAWGRLSDDNKTPLKGMKNG